MFSMTGFGTGKYIKDGREMVVEVKSVNHRFLDINQKMPKSLSFLEGELRDAVSSKLDRGHVDIFVSYDNCREDHKKVEVDNTLLTQYISAINSIKDSHPVAGEISIDDIMKMQGVFKITQDEDDQKAICELAREATYIALDKLVAMRKAEGYNLYKDISKRMANLKNMFEKIVEIAPRVPVDYKEKLRIRLEELLLGSTYSEERMLAEAAIFADKCNIDEEIARFKSHVMQFEKSMELDIPVGRKMDFTLQEINREINTIGSKANYADISTVVMDIKAELEKIREQIQNIE